jgi:hypothetical protein
VRQRDQDIRELALAAGAAEGGGPLTTGWGGGRGCTADAESRAARGSEILGPCAPSDAMRLYRGPQHVEASMCDTPPTAQPGILRIDEQMFRSNDNRQRHINNWDDRG